MKFVISLLLLFVCFIVAHGQTQQHTFPVCSKQPKDWSKKGKVWYVDPVKGKPTNDGSKTKPWQSVNDVFENKTAKWVINNWDRKYPVNESLLVSKNSNGPVKGGDVIVLLPGNHGQITIKNTYNQKRIFVTSLPGSNNVVVDLLRVYSSANITIACLNITSTSVPSSTSQTLVTLGGSATSGPTFNVYFDSNIIFSFPDIYQYKTSADSLNKYAGQGIAINEYGYYNRLARNYIYNVRRGVIVNSPYNYAGYNTVNYFFGDSFRVLHNHTHVEFNVAQNIMNVDDNKDHRDAIQMFTKANKNSLTNILINNNRFISNVDTARPFAAHFQGISSFDVNITNVRVLYNLISTGHYNGIVMSRSTNCTVIGNTLVDPTEKYNLWISFPSGVGGNVALNNIAESTQKWESVAKKGGNYFKNLAAKDHAKWFASPAQQDWHLKSATDSPFIGKGVDPTVDLLRVGFTGPVDTDGFDIGCFPFDA